VRMQHFLYVLEDEASLLCLGDLDTEFMKKITDDIQLRPRLSSLHIMGEIPEKFQIVGLRSSTPKLSPYVKPLPGICTKLDIKR